MNDDSFDLERAERLLPQLERLLRAALESRKQVVALGQEQTRETERIVRSGGSQVDLARFSRRKKEKEEWGDRLRQAVEEIENLGCLVKDLDIGLVDFPGRIGEREVCLCWKLGEPGIRHWHGIEEGFAGRKPIDEKFVQELQRSRVH